MDRDIVFGGEFDLLISGAEINRDMVFRRLNTLNMIHHFSQGNGNSVRIIIGKDRIDTFTRNLERSIASAQILYDFLVENRMALDEVESNFKALLFGRFADAVSMFEEYMTKEDPIKDILIQLIPYFLSMASERSYISSAQIGHRGILQTNTMQLYSEIYDLVKDTRHVTDPEEAKEIADGMHKLFTVMNELADKEEGIMIFILLHLMVYNLRAGEVLNILNHERKG